MEERQCSLANHVSKNIIFLHYFLLFFMHLQVINCCWNACASIMLIITSRDSKNSSPSFLFFQFCRHTVITSIGAKSLSDGRFESILPWWGTSVDGRGSHEVCSIWCLQQCCQKFGTTLWTNRPEYLLLWMHKCACCYSWILWWHWQRSGRRPL